MSKATYKITITNPNTHRAHTYISFIPNFSAALRSVVERVEDITPVGDLPNKGDWKVSATSRFPRH